MSNEIFKSLVFLAIALVTIGLSYLYQRRARLQKLRMIWLWPAIFFLLAAHAVWQNWPIDDIMLKWMIGGFCVGLLLGTARGFAFKVRSSDKPGTIVLQPTLLSGSIFMIALLYNEYVHVFHWGEPNLRRIACSLLILTVGNSIAANVTRVINWKLSRT